MNNFIKNNFNCILLSLAILFVMMTLTGCGFSVKEMDQNPSNDLEPDRETNSEIGSKVEAEDGNLIRPIGWGMETHSKEAEPNYEVVFPQDSVNRIKITITADNWKVMMDDMTEMMGEFGSSYEKMQGNAPDLPENARPDVGWPGITRGEEITEGERQQFPEGLAERPGGGEPPDGWMVQPPNGGGAWPNDMNPEGIDKNPVWVTATIEFDGQIWENVGIRFKGNSSLRDAWSSGNLKIPFKLDFDQFEDDFPEIKDQRFYGFKQLSLANNFSDDSFLREKVTADIFREFGVAAAHTAFYEVYVDTGDGLAYFGLYTLVEMVEDTVIEQQFSDGSGNLYKPEGSGATFKAGSFNETSFDKETNQSEADYSDILAVFDALHATNRMSDPSAWREGLESVFDVDTFLRWLAVNTIVQNWDTYGVMSHNYYLYMNPETDLVTWIPWDNNMALADSFGRRGGLSLSLSEVMENWPLIRFIMDDPVYKAQYEANLGEVIKTAFDPEAMSEAYIFYHDLISESVMKETPEATMLRSKNTFDDTLQELIDHVNQRYQTVQLYLSNR